MKRTIIILLLSVMAVGGMSQSFYPPAYIDKTPAEIKFAYSVSRPNYNIIYKDDMTIVYYSWRSDILATYMFIKGRCRMFALTLNQEEGEAYIGLNWDIWTPRNDLIWTYTNSDEKTIAVSLSFRKDDAMTFIHYPWDE